MLEGIGTVNWDSLGFPEMPMWLAEIASGGISPHEKAIDGLRQKIAPWQLLAGYGSTVEYAQFHGLINSEILFYTIPFLIELIQSVITNDADKVSLLDLLYELCRYRYLVNSIPLAEKDNFEAWICEVYDLILRGKDIYVEICKKGSSELQGAAKDILTVLESDAQNCLQ
jgi:hypothetical protein